MKRCSSRDVMKHPGFYRYMAIFTFEDDGIHIIFPDLPGCLTFGKDEEEAVKMAKEALSLHLYGMEQDEDDIPAPSTMKELAKEEQLEANESFCLIEVFMPPFREKQNSRFVKKTLFLLSLSGLELSLLFSETVHKKHCLRTQNSAGLANPKNSLGLIFDFLGIVMSY